MRHTWFPRGNNQDDCCCHESVLYFKSMPSDMTGMETMMISYMPQPFRKWALAASFAAMLLSVDVGAQNQRVPDLSKTIEGARKSVVEILDDGRPVGSGFAARSEGYIATNLHVLSSVARPEVRTASGERYSSLTVMAYDVLNDLAVLKVNGIRLAPLQSATAESPKPGKTVIAMGSPEGLGGTSTVGVISAVRDDPTGSGMRLIQTDAAINPGNSGGPLIDERGRLIGIVVSRHRDAQNLGFAIPVQYLTALLQTKHEPISFSEFREKLFSDRDYLAKMARTLPQLWRDQNGYMFRAKLDDNMLALERIFPREEQGFSQYGRMVLRRNVDIYSGSFVSGTVCIPPTLEPKTCELATSVRAKLTGSSVILLEGAAVKKFDCSTCTQSELGQFQVKLFPATSSDTPRGTGVASLVEKAGQVRAQKQVQDQQRVLAERREAIERRRLACQAALEYKRTSCPPRSSDGQPFAYGSFNCGQADSVIREQCYNFRE